MPNNLTLSDSPLPANLNPAQKEAITFGAGPLLIVAGAGTGKTTVITQRLAWLIENGLAKPDEILALTFTDKAAEEMEERVDKLLPYGFLDIWISTFHAFGDRLLRQHGLDIGLPNDFKVLTPTQTWLLARRNLDKFALDYYRPLGNPTKFIHALIKHFSRCKDEEISPADYLKYAEELKLNSDGDPSISSRLRRDSAQDDKNEISRLLEIADGFHVYNQLLLDNGALDFGDLINYTLKLFKTRLKILEKYRRQFKYILIDEFQDTNLAQYELIKLLAAPKNNLTVVGDDDQSIYKFRGASISNILHFKKEFPAAKEVVISQSFRSCQNILDLAYQLIKNNNPERLESKLGINKKLTAVKEGSGIIERLHARTAEEEARLVAEKILEIYYQRTAPSWNDFAILVRANSQADNFMLGLDRAGIPYQFLASSGLYRQPIVMDILAYLRLLDNYHENIALFRVLNLSLWKLDSSDLIRLNHFAKKKNWSLYETLKQAPALALKPEGLKTVNQLLGLMEKHTALAREQSVGKVILAFLTDSGYLSDLTSREQCGESEAIKQILYLKKFFDNVSEFEKSRPEKQVKHYLEDLNYILESGEEGSLAGALDEGPEAVKIMTAHGAKGLEFRYVFVVNLVEQKFPSHDRPDPIEIPDALVKEIIPSGDIHLQEERRLFYVAVTRAQDGVFFTSADDYGGTRKRKPTRFLYEIGMDKIAASSLRGSRGMATPLPSVGARHDSRGEATSPLPLPKHFSYTQLKAFETCPLQYKFAHLLQIPTKGRATFSFGKTMHSALQKFYQKIIELNSIQQNDLFSPPQQSNKIIKAPPLDELLSLYDASWLDDWYQDKKQKQDYYEKGKKNLKEFYEFNREHWTIPRALENGFHLKIGEHNLRGQIDRIDVRPDGAVELIDYKTGAAKAEEKITAEDKEQLLIYQMAAEDSLRLKPALLSFYYLNNNQKVSFLGSAEEIQKIKEKINQTIEEIKLSDFPARPSSHHCRHCDYKEICEEAEI